MRRILGIALLVGALAGVRDVDAHCQVPCGIYDDEARFTLMNEHVTTIEKAMTQITAEGQPQNQVVRWVANKDQHADNLSQIATYYFLAQRIAPVDPSDAEAYTAYTAKLALLHGIVHHAMKCKQTTDGTHVESLRTLITAFHEAYGHGH